MTPPGPAPAGRLPVRSDGLLDARVFELSGPVPPFRLRPASAAGWVVLGGWILLAVLFVAAALVPYAPVSFGLVVAGAILGIVLAVEATVSRVRHARDRAAGRGRSPVPSVPDTVVERFADWASDRFGLDLDAAQVRCLLGEDEVGNTVEVDGVEVMLGTPARLRGREGAEDDPVFSLIALPGGDELPRRPGYRPRAR